MFFKTTQDIMARKRNDQDILQNVEKDFCKWMNVIYYFYAFVFQEP